MPDPRNPKSWRPRHARILAFLGLFCLTTADIASFFGGTTVEVRERQASRWLVTQRRRNRVRMVGIVQEKATGRPAYIYGRYAKQQELFHELAVGRFALVYREHWTFSRDAAVGKTVADAAMTNGGRKAWLEVDNAHKQTKAQYRAKWRLYSGVQDFVLVVCHTERRMQKVRSWSEPVREIALFTTFERLASEQDEPWIDFDGHSTEL